MFLTNERKYLAMPHVPYNLTSHKSKAHSNWRPHLNRERNISNLLNGKPIYAQGWSGVVVDPLTWPSTSMELPQLPTVSARVHDAPDELLHQSYLLPTSLPIGCGQLPCGVAKVHQPLFISPLGNVAIHSNLSRFTFCIQVEHSSIEPNIHILRLLIVLLDSLQIDANEFRNHSHSSWGLVFGLNKGPTRRQMVGLWTHVSVLPTT